MKALALVPPTPRAKTFEWGDKWDGGRVRRDKKGEPVWVIERQYRGRRYAITLDVTSERAAMAELALFERDPAAYGAHAAAPDPAVAGGPVLLTEETVVDSIDARLRGDAERPAITRKHALDMLRYLQNWETALAGKDLRKVTLLEYRALLRGLEPARQHVTSLRALAHWLRREGRLASHEDASRDLIVPQTRHKRTQVGFRIPTMEEFEKLYAHILIRLGRRDQFKMRPEAIQAVRDFIVLRALCGVHSTEVQRIAEGRWPVTAVAGVGEIAGVVKFIHKKGLPHPQALPKKALDAALRLQALGWVPDGMAINRVLDEAAEDAGVPSIRPSVLRHAFISWARTYGRIVRPAAAGVSIEAIAEIVGHTSVKTTAIYDGTEVPPMIALPLKLENEEDPPSR